MSKQKSPGKSLLIVFSLLLCSLSALAQGPESVFLELAGSGGVGSLNYEHNFLRKGNHDLHGRVGLTFAPIDKNNGWVFGVPLMAHWVYGPSKHKLDVGLGPALSIAPAKGGGYVRGLGEVGYRFEAEKNPFFVRFAYTPFFSFLFDFQWEHWVGVSLGYRLSTKKGA